MTSPATLSRDNFNQACQEFVQKYSELSQEKNEKYSLSLYGWKWIKHASIPSWGYLSRTVFLKHLNELDSNFDNEKFDDEEVVEVEDESCAPETGLANRLYFHESIVWHPTYMVPAYYFQAVDSGGTPISLKQILATGRFQHRAFQNAGINITNSAVQPIENDNAQFPLLSQGDHPILGTSHWYFHPCQTSSAVTEILDQMSGIQWNQRGARAFLCWLEAWFVVLSTAIDLH